MLSRLFSFFFFFFFWLVNKFYAFLNFRRRVNESRALESNLLIIICGDSLARNFLGENACWRWRAGKWRGCGLHCGYHTLTSFQRAWNFLWSTSPPVWTKKCNLGAKMQNAECKMLKMLRAANFLSWRPAKKSHAKYGIKSNPPPNAKNGDREAASQHCRCIVRVRSHFVNFWDLAKEGPRTKGPKECPRKPVVVGIVAA